MEISLILNDIKVLTEAMLEEPEEERILVYRQLNRHFLDLEGNPKLRSNARLHSLLDQLKVHLIALARLDDPDQLSDEQHLNAAIQTIAELNRLLGT